MYITAQQPRRVRQLGCCPARRRRMRSGLGDDSFVAAGTRLVYVVQWASGSTHISGPQDVAAQIRPILSSQWGIEIDGEQDAATSIPWLTQATGFTLQVHTARDYGVPSDIKSILDGEILRAGRSIVSSTIAVTQTPQITTVPNAVLPAASDLLSTLPSSLNNYLPWLIGGVGLLFVAREIL